MNNDLKRAVSKEKKDLLYSMVDEEVFTPVIFDAILKPSEKIAKMIEDGKVFYLPKLDSALMQKYDRISFSDLFKQLYYHELGIASGYSAVEVAAILEEETSKIVTVDSATTCYEKAKSEFIILAKELFKEEGLFVELKEFLKNTNSEIVVVSWYLNDRFLEAKTKGWLAKFLEELRSTLK